MDPLFHALSGRTSVRLSQTKTRKEHKTRTQCPIYIFPTLFNYFQFPPIDFLFAHMCSVGCLWRPVRDQASPCDPRCSSSSSESYSSTVSAILVVVYDSTRICFIIGDLMKRVNSPCRSCS